jgi:hypothetical protein
MFAALNAHKDTLKAMVAKAEAMAEREREQADNERSRADSERGEGICCSSALRGAPRWRTSSGRLSPGLERGIEVPLNIMEARAADARQPRWRVWPPDSDKLHGIADASVNDAVNRALLVIDDQGMKDLLGFYREFG